MQQTYSVNAIIRNEQRAKAPKASIMIRITVNSRRAEISIKRHVDPDRWDSKANRVKGNKEDAREINSLIDTYVVKINRIHQRMIEDEEVVSAE